MRDAAQTPSAMPIRRPLTGELTDKRAGNIQCPGLRQMAQALVGHAVDGFRAAQGFSQRGQGLHMLRQAHMRPKRIRLAVAQKTAQKRFAGRVQAHDAGHGCGVGFGVVIMDCHVHSIIIQFGLAGCWGQYNK